MRKGLLLFLIALLAAVVALCQGASLSGQTAIAKRARSSVRGEASSLFSKRQNKPEDTSTTDTTTSTDDKKKDTTTSPDNTKTVIQTDDKKDNSTSSTPSQVSTDTTTSTDDMEKDTTTSPDTTKTVTQTDDKKDNTTSSTPSQGSTTDNKKDETSSKNTTTSATGNGTSNSTTVDADAPVIDFLLSNYWNSTYFLAQSDPHIQFVKNGNYSDTTQNSSSTQPLIIGIEVLERRQFQIMEGLGAGLTDASAIVLQALKASHPDAYDEILNLCFNEAPEWLERGGAGMNMIRTPIGASDFGFVEYTYDDTYDGTADVNMTHFDISKSPKRWATIQDILKINPKLRVMATPWSQPAWMKGSNGTLHGGSVLEKYEDAFATYLVKFVQELEAKEHIKIDTLSLQNEPMYDGAMYPCTKMPAYQQARISPLVRQKLDAANYKSIGLLAYDHNWDNDTYPVEVFDEAAENFKGVAWHCYGGDPDGQDTFNNAYPGKTVWFTECTKISQYFMEPWVNIKDQFSKLITTESSVDYQSSAVILWNLALQVDDDGFTTPTVPGVCKNCLAPILVFNNGTNGTLEGADQGKLDTIKSSTSDTGVTPTKPPSRRSLLPRDDTPATQNTSSEQNSRIMVAGQGGPNSTNPSGKLNEGAANENDIIPPVRETYYRSSDFVVLAHLGRAIRPQENNRWAQRVGVKSSEDEAINPRIRTQLFRNDLGNGTSRWSLIVLQWNDHFGYNFAKFEDATLQIKFRDYVAEIRLPPGAFTMQWTAKDSVYETNPSKQQKTLGGGPSTKKAQDLRKKKNGGDASDSH